MSEDNNMYSVTGQYFSPPLCYPTYNPESPQVGPPVRATEPPQRKRKYTRSKTGCMTCRVKKVKCDESKPICTRCTHGARECSWPDGVPTRKRTSSKRDSVDEMFLTLGLVAESPGLSESPPSSGREQTPPYCSLADLVPISPRSSPSYESTPFMSPDHNARSIYPHQPHSYPMTSASQYTTRYDHPDPQTVPCGIPSISSIRQYPLPQANPVHWTSDLDTCVGYYNHRVSLQENVLAGQPSSPHDHPHHRFYQ